MRLSILFLDDDPCRHATFAVLTRGHWVDHCWFVDDAMERLSRHRYDLACLDHDLATEEFSRDGREVVRHIARLCVTARPRAVLVHSRNPIRSVDMESALAPHYEPGVTLLRTEFGSFTVAAPGSTGGDGPDLGRWITPAEPDELNALASLLSSASASSMPLA